MSAEGSGVSGEERPRRPYDSPVRRSRAADTAARIVDAGVQLAREQPSWDWRAVTMQAVADRAGVGRRTVYRHYGSEAVLRDAIVERLQADADVGYESMTIETVPTVSTRVIDSMASFGASPWALLPVSFPEIDAKRRDGLRKAVLAEIPPEVAPGPEGVAAVLDIIWGVPAYEILVRDWHMAPDEAKQLLSWLYDVVITAVRDEAPRHTPRARKRR